MCFHVKHFVFFWCVCVTFFIQQGRVNTREQRIFWLALVLFPMVWGLLFITALLTFKLSWVVSQLETRMMFAKHFHSLCPSISLQVLVVIAIILNGANLYGYIKCNYGSNTNLNSAATDFVRKQVFRNAFDFISRSSQPAPNNSSSGIV